MISLLKTVAGIAFATVSAVAVAQPSYKWMHSDVAAAWKQGYTGQGVNLYVPDLYKSLRANGSMTGTSGSWYNDYHGNFTSLQASLTAPGARIIRQEAGTAALTFDRTRLNVVNVSYGFFASKTSTLAAQQAKFKATEQSIVAAATAGTAVVVLAAGNDAKAINVANHKNQINYLTQAVTGAQSAIFVGALNNHGSTTAKATIASYSNTAGNDPVVQRQTLFVGVDTKVMGLGGTSYAAPQVSGYAAIIGSKFRNATPTQVVNQLLTTARTDTIANYSAAVHGRGEASLSRALAPTSIR